MEKLKERNPEKEEWERQREKKRRVRGILLHRVFGVLGECRYQGRGGLRNDRKEERSREGEWEEGRERDRGA